MGSSKIRLHLLIHAPTHGGGLWCLGELGCQVLDLVVFFRCQIAGLCEGVAQCQRRLAGATLRRDVDRGGGDTYLSRAALVVGVDMLGG